MKQPGRTWVIVALAVLLALPTAAQAEMFVEGLLGGTTAADMGSPSFHQKDLRRRRQRHRRQTRRRIE